MSVRLRRWGWLLLGLFWLLGPAQAATLLWITADITPAARVALLQRLSGEAGLTLQHLQYPLRGAEALTPAERREADQALQQAAMVWLEAPHPTVQARLTQLLAPALAAAPCEGRSRLWVPAEGATPPPPPGGCAATATDSRIAAYLANGGEANTRHALALAQALLRHQPLPELPPPQRWPAQGVYHPDAPGVLADAAAFARWQDGQPPLQGKPTVAVLVHRYHFVNGSTGWLDAWLRAFERQGLVAYAVFGQQLDLKALPALMEAPAGRLQARVIVTHQLLTPGAALQPLFERWGAPVLATQPYRSGDTAAWERDPVGLGLADVPFYLSQPESAGAIDPVLVSAQRPDGRVELIARQAEAVVAKARRLVRLQDTAPADKRLALMVYNYPRGASNFGANFLNVPRSLEQVSQGLAEAGYRTERRSESEWIAAMQPLLAAYYSGAAPVELLRQGQAAALPLAQYEAWWAGLPAAVRQRIEARWGPPSHSRFVVRWQGQPVFVIPRLQVGQLAVLPQPPRDETPHDAVDALQQHRTGVPLSHHYLAVYLWARQADALLHFGTHGTVEWAEGKSRALDVFDDAQLPLGDVPVIYPFIVDDLGEALTAKRRGRALMLGHRTPAFSPAGLDPATAKLHDGLHEWSTLDDGPTRQLLERQLVAQFAERHLDRDLGWSAARIAGDFAGFMDVLHPYLDQIAQSAQPQGLAVFGRVPSAEQRRATVLQALRQPLLAALGGPEAMLVDHTALQASRPARWVDQALRGEDDEPALKALAERARALDRLLATEGEMPGLLAALAGRFVPAAYGGDPIRNPDSLPTGRNLTGLDPSRLPTPQAYQVAQGLFDRWLQAWRSEHKGRYPTRLALTLWAGETLRHHGVMEAQALVALGVQPQWDDSGRPSGLRVLPAAELQRPRVDVLLSVTGSYRDQFPALMALLDRAVVLAATAEPGNAVQAQTDTVAAELRQRGVGEAQAQQLARARIFGNAGGDYGNGLEAAVLADGLQRDDARLGAMFLQRMSQPYVGGEPLAGVPAAAAVQALGAHLRHSDAALMPRSSNLHGMLSSDDPFQYLGGLAAAARSAGRTEPLALYVHQLQDVDAPASESATRAIAREMQTRYLHPGWLAAQKAEGYSGTLQVLKALQYAWGWQVTAPETVRPDHWQSFYEVLVRDREHLGVPQWLRSANPQAYAQALERLVQADRLGHWQPDAATRRSLARVYAELTRRAPLHTELSGVRRWVDGQARPVHQVEAEQGIDVAPLSRPPPLRGIRLLRKPEAASKRPSENPLWRALAAMLAAFCFVGGMAVQWRRPLCSRSV